MPTCKLDLNLTAIAGAPLVLAVDVGHNLDRQETGCIRGGVGLARRKARIAQPSKNQVGIHRKPPRHLRYRNVRRRRLQADRPLLIVRPKPLHPTRHAITIVSTIDRGHYPALSARGRAVRPDAYVYGSTTSTEVLLVTLQTRPPGGRSGAARRRIRALIPGEGKGMLCEP